MKKILFLLISILASVNIANARASALSHYTASSYSIKYVKYNFGTPYWTDWSPDYSCNIDIYFIKVQPPQIIIESQEPQVYYVVDVSDDYYDSKGFQCYDLKVINKDGYKGTIWIRCGPYYTQIYVMFADIMWVYEVR